MRSLPFVLTFILVCGAGHAATYCVDPLAGGADNGGCWTDAFDDLQSALAIATGGDVIWVAGGVYKPSVEVDVDMSGGIDPREVTFNIPSGVALYGGFAGGEVMLDQRDVEANPTILSGDIDDNDVNVDGNDIAESTADIVGDNAYHVVFTERVSAATLLDGFVVTAGKAGDFAPLGFSPNRSGGGWYNRADPPGDVSSPAIRNSRFEGNYAERSGGAFFIGAFTAGTYAPTIEDCWFGGNEAERAGGALYLLGDATHVKDSVFAGNATTVVSGGLTDPGAGGAVRLVASNASFERAMFIGNLATGNPTGPFEGGGGGAVYVSTSSSPTDDIGASEVTFESCGFYDNETGGNGGAWGGAATHYSDGGNLTVQYTNCVFHGNAAMDDGGAVANFARTIMPPAMLPPLLDVTFTNSTFVENQAGEEGGAIYSDGFEFMGVEMLTMRLDNDILFGNDATNSDPAVFNNADNVVSFSLIEGSGGSGGGWDASIGVDGGGNIDTDPQFVDPADPDGPDGRPGTNDDGLVPDSTSPAVNAGTNAAPGLVGVAQDFRRGARIVGDVVDMGAYEFDRALFVELDALNAWIEPGGIRLEWRTSVEIDNFGFRILRARGTDRTAFVEASVEPIVIVPYLPAAADTFGGADYEYLDAERQPAGTILYYLEDIDVLGRTRRHGPLICQTEPLRGLPGDRATRPCPKARGENPGE